MDVCEAVEAFNVMYGFENFRFLKRTSAPVVKSEFFDLERVSVRKPQPRWDTEFIKKFLQTHGIRLKPAEK